MGAREKEDSVILIRASDYYAAPFYGGSLS
jgi:hypothetical protein